MPVKTPVGPETKIKLQDEYLGAREARAALKGQLDQIKSQHSGRYTEHRTALTKIQQDLFGPYSEVLKTQSAAELAKFPAYFRNDPSAPLLADALALLTLAGQAITAQNKKAPAVAANAAAARMAPPTRDGVQPGTGRAGSASVPNLDEYKMLKSMGAV